MATSLFGEWIRLWYIVNLFVLIPDWLYVVLRPRTFEDGDLGWLCKIFNVYAKIDTLFLDESDKFLKFTYFLGGIDILLCLYLTISFNTQKTQASFAVLAICRATSVCTKTLLYMIYSYDFILPQWRLAIYLLFSPFCLFPLAVILNVSTRLTSVLKSKQV
ncbi:unnamed protein product [Chondrus crispus]|uniref:EXPERA domain-containing protein n=1 Tax=Chondrus crispus TaxID=2769 RepID=R7QB62_CHOCR|nr:unnamed protein product [Chondrus crispus]CDF34661.1 unnamed protein product [Chondrus crispus]|eukprot:XP_005714480.1 unnamed protein product [Chondrus crispus]